MAGTAARNRSPFSPWTSTPLVCLLVLGCGIACSVGSGSTDAGTGNDASIDAGGASALDAGTDAGLDAGADAGGFCPPSDGQNTFGAPGCCGWQGSQSNYPTCPAATVCAGQCYAPQYVVNGDGTVTDEITGLVWQQSVPSGRYNWSGETPPAIGSAQSYCETLTLDGGSWRLPTNWELYSLVELGNAPSIDATAFPNTPRSYFWTASFVSMPNGDAGSVDLPWYVHFGGGQTGWDYTVAADVPLNVRCVR